MKFDPNSETPIFIQIAQQIEDAVFTGAFWEETKVPSTNEISVLWGINPHTVLKGMNLLVEEAILYKRRGLGMYVKEGAVERIRAKRQSAFYEQYIEAMLREADKLHLTKDQIISLIERGYAHERH